MIASRGGARLVVLSLALVIGCNGAPENSPEPSSTGASSPSPSPSPTLEPSTPQASEPSAVLSAATSREPLASLSAWRPVTDAVLGQASQVYPPAWSGQRFVVAGIQDSKVAFWTSPSGDGWATTDERTYGYTSEFAFEPSGVAVAVGWLNLGGAAWTSEDGLRWTKVPDQAAFRPEDGEIAVRLLHVAHGEAGYVAIGDFSAPVNPGWTLFSSPDGTYWTRHSADTFGGASLLGIAAVADRYVIAGTIGEYSDDPTAAVWTSIDGRSWDETRLDASQVAGIAEAPTGIMVTGSVVDGHEPTASPMDGSDRAFWSADGSTWEAVPSVAHRPRELHPAPWGLVAIAEPGPDCGSGVWLQLLEPDWTCAGGPAPLWPTDGVARSSTPGSSSPASRPTSGSPRSNGERRLIARPRRAMPLALHGVHQRPRSLRQPPARLLAMISRKRASSAGSLIASPWR